MVLLFNRPALPNGGILQPHYTPEETAIIMEETTMGRSDARALFREAMLYTDMPLSFNANANADLVPQYNFLEAQHGAITREVTLKDLRKQSYKEIWPVFEFKGREGGKARKRNKAPLVGPNDEFPTATLDESNIDLFIDKYGFRLPFTMEMVINDELDTLAQYPQAMAAFMRRMEDTIVAEALIQPDGNGALSTLTRITGNPVLSVDSIAAAYDQLKHVTVHGAETGIENAALVVPRTLELAAKRYVSTATFDYTENGKTFKGAANPAYGLPVVVFDALTNVNIGTKAAATWFIVANVGATLGRPGLAAAKLRGFTDPQIYISSPNALTPAGGLANWQEGSFLNDSIQFKARHFFGSTVVFLEGILVSEPA